jgi:hypothetical protein
MKINHDEIYKIALQYFPRDVIDNFVKLISDWEVEMKASFFQVSQEGNDLLMEFGALIGEAVLDITSKKDSSKIVVVPLSSIALIILDDYKDITILNISPPGMRPITYRASLEKSRSELKEYAKNLNRVIIAKKN